MGQKNLPDDGLYQKFAMPSDKSDRIGMAMMQERSPRLLIVEDDEALSALLEEYLGEGGYQVSVCRRGDVALDMLKKTAFDLILTDMVLPGADGLTILSTAGAEPVRTLVILMTGYSGIEDAIEAVGKGAYDFVSKPFQLPEIRVRLDNASRYQLMLRQLAVHAQS